MQEDQSVTAVAAQAAPPGVRAEPLDAVLLKYRPILIGGYLALVGFFLLLVAVLNAYASPEIFHALFAVIRGDETPWASVLEIGASHDMVLATFAARLVEIGLYLALQFVLLWGLGHLYIGSRRRGAWLRYFVSLVIVAFAAAVLVLGAFWIFGVGIQTTWSDYLGTFFEKPATLQVIVDFNPLVVFGAGWAVWLVLGLIYWRFKTPSCWLQRAIRILLATSWIEFSLALPIDIAARNRSEDCPCAPMSWAAVTLILPMMIWLVGPALFLVYLREAELCHLTPGRARAILWRKTVLVHARSRNVTSHVSTARTLSLAAIVLGLIGFQLGVFNNQRSSLYTDVRGLLALQYLHTLYPNDAALAAKIEQGDSGTQSSPDAASPAAAAADDAGAGGGGYLLPVTPFGRMTVKLDVSSSGSQTFELLGMAIVVPADKPFSVTVETDDSKWTSAKLSLDDNHLADLDKRLTDIGVDTTKKRDAAFVTEIGDKLYSRRVTVPGIDFGEFSTESGAWMAALLCIGVLVVLRNSIHQIFRGTDVGIDEPWLVLDAETVLEKFVAAIWLLGLWLSGWLAVFGLVLSVMDVFQFSSWRPSIAEVEISFAIFAVLAVLGMLTASGAVIDLMRLREIRKDIAQEGAEGSA